MASNPRLKSQRQESDIEKDPLAELSRIMGLDSRLRAEAEEMDFGIDLEQELLGELTSLESPANDAIAPPAHAAVAQSSRQPDANDALSAVDAEIDMAFENMFAEPAVAEPTAMLSDMSAEPVAHAPARDLAIDESDFAIDLSDELDPQAAAAAPAETVSLYDEDSQFVAGGDVPAVAGDLSGEHDLASVDEAFAAFAEAAAVSVVEDHDVPVGPVSFGTMRQSLEDELKALLSGLGPVAAATQPVQASGDDEADWTARDEDGWQDEKPHAEMRAAAEEAPASTVSDAASPELSAPEPVTADDAEAVAAADFDLADFDLDALESVSIEDDAGSQSVETASDAIDVSASADAEILEIGLADIEPVETAPVEAVAAAEPGSSAMLADAAPSAALDEPLAAEAAASPEVDGIFEIVEALAADSGTETAASHFDADAFEAELHAMDFGGHAEPVGPVAAIGPEPTVADHDLEAEAEAGPAPLIRLSTPAPVASDADRRELALDEDFHAAIDDFTDTGDWSRAADPAPVADTAWSEELRPTAAARPAAPTVDGDDDDPFNILAALAAAPPILRTMSRATPVAAQPSAAAPREAAPSRGFAPAPVAREAASSGRDIPSRPSLATPRPAAQAPVAAPPPAAMSTESALDELLRSFAGPVATAGGEQPAPAPQPAPAASASSVRSSLFPTPGSQPRASSAYAPRAATLAAAAPVAASILEQSAPRQHHSEAPAYSQRSYVPDIETVDVPDEAVNLADEFDIPELAAEDPAPRLSDFDDLETEFAHAFSQLRLEPVAPAPAQSALADVDFDADFDRIYEDDIARVNQASAQFTALARDDEPRYADEYDDAGAPLSDADFDDEIYAADAGQPRRSRGLLIAGIVAAVAIAGGVGAFALSFGDSGNGAPALVKADASPVKVKPANPGGTVVPNQDNKVYNTVVGQPPAAPTQEKLISGAEEPIAKAPAAAPATSTSVALTPAAALPGVEAPQIKNEDRVTPAQADNGEAEANEVLAISPRKVRTMIVRPDGSLVARETPPALAKPVEVAVAQPEPAAIAQPAPVAAAPVEETAPAAVAPEVIVPEPRPVTEAPKPVVETPKPVEAAVEKPAKPVAQKPAPKPKPEVVAVAQPEPTVELAGGAAVAAASGLWSVQIASQPTREGAQASYEDLARRFGGVLGGKGVNIVKADIEGKGTYWRVRVPAASKNDANILCAKLKTAGGSCYVSK